MNVLTSSDRSGLSRATVVRTKLPTPDTRDAGQVGIHAGPSSATLLRTSAAGVRALGKGTDDGGCVSSPEAGGAGLPLRVAGTAALSD